MFIRSHLKNRILVQVPPLKLSGIIRRDRVSTRRHTIVFRGVEVGPNTEIGVKGLFEVTSSVHPLLVTLLARAKRAGLLL